MKQRNILQSLSNTTDNKYLVIGTMSSGKSTLLNSLIGFELFPSKNEACTAKTITYIANSRKKTFIYNHNRSSMNITSSALSSEQIIQWNADSEINEIIIKGPLQTVVNKRFVLIDTPGPNNSMDAEHRQMMQKALKTYTYNKILYVLNATQLGTDDDQNLLTLIKEEAIGKEILFIVNKTDEIEENNLENLVTFAQNVNRYLQKNGFNDVSIYFVSALSAILGKNIDSNTRLTRKQKLNYDQLNALVEKNLAIHNLNTPKYSSKKLKTVIKNKLWNNSGIKELLYTI